MIESTRAVFLSYASQDADAARRIAEALRAAGVEVWFDQEALRGGDAWDQKIRRQIKECAMFVPVISANTQSRAEGYFRLEWRLGVERSLLMADDAPFLFPIVIGDVSEAAARVPDKFREVQWTRLKLEETATEIAARVARLLEPEAGAPFDGPRGRASGAPLQRIGKRGLERWWWLIFPIMGMSVPIIGVLKRPAKPERPPPAAPSTPATSEARQLAGRAQTIARRPSLTRAQLDAAAELCERALQLDGTDALVWAVAADVELYYIHPYGYDVSDARRRRVQERIGRAVSLDPDLMDVKVVQAKVHAHAVGTPSLMAEAEATFRELIGKHPGDKRLVSELAEVVRNQGRFDDAAKLFESIGEYEIAGWSYFNGGQLRPALAAVAKAPRSVTALLLEAELRLRADEDLDAAWATIARLQPSDLLAEMPAVQAIKLSFFKREPERMLDFARGLSEDYLDSHAFSGPLGFFKGIAHELAGREVHAEVEWRAALELTEERLGKTPDDRLLLLWSAWLHAALKDTAGAERRFARSQALGGLQGDSLDMINWHFLARLRKSDALLRGAEALLAARPSNWERVHAEMRFSPEFDFLRGDPRFEKLLRENMPEGAKPLP